MKYLSFILILFLLYACSATKTQVTIQNIEFKSVAKNTNGRIQELTQTFYTNQAAFEKAWNMAWSNFSDPTPTPQIDFKKNTVVLVALGMRNNGGYQLKINSVREEAGQIIVDYTEITPNPKCNTTQAIVFPYEFISFAKTSKKIVFNASAQVGSCN